LECAQALKAGYLRTVLLPGRKKQQVHEYYTSWSQACRDNTVIRKALATTGVSPGHLLRRMHGEDPKLVRRTVYLKRQLTEQQQKERRCVAAQLLLACLVNITWLLATWWVDETTVWITNNKVNHQKVWCDASDQGVRDVIHHDSVTDGKKIKVHMMAAVNALEGAVLFEFTTGTTDLEHTHPEMPAEPYKVTGGSSQTYPPAAHARAPSSTIMWPT
jgi:hypothetical protein